MNEPIIIDDIDVSECRYFFIDKNKKTCSICLKECKSSALCYYKQLQRLKEENKLWEARVKGMAIELRVKENIISKLSADNLESLIKKKL